MNLGALLKSIIYVLSSSLLYPVLALLALLAAGILFYSGAFFSEWVERARTRRRAAGDRPWLAIANGDFSGLSPFVQRYCADLSSLLTAEMREEAIEYLFQERRQKAQASLDPLRLVIRAGPSLGLMGTLIPMGTGLAALGQGDMTRLASDLVIAFTTTVVGLLEGTLAYTFHLVKVRWVEEDLRDMELATEILSFRTGKDNAIYGT